MSLSNFQVHRIQAFTICIFNNKIHKESLCWLSISILSILLLTVCLWGWPGGQVRLNFGQHFKSMMSVEMYLDKAENKKLIFWTVKWRHIQLHFSFHAYYSILGWFSQNQTHIIDPLNEVPLSFWWWISLSRGKLASIN